MTSPYRRRRITAAEWEFHKSHAARLRAAMIRDTFQAIGAALAELVQSVRLAAIRHSRKESPCASQ